MSGSYPTAEVYITGAASNSHGAADAAAVALAGVDLVEGPSQEPTSPPLPPLTMQMLSLPVSPFPILVSSLTTAQSHRNVLREVVPPRGSATTRWPTFTACLTLSAPTTSAATSTRSSRASARRSRLSWPSTPPFSPSTHTTGTWSRAGDATATRPMRSQAPPVRSRQPPRHPVLLCAEQSDQEPLPEAAPSPMLLLIQICPPYRQMGQTNLTPYDCKAAPTEETPVKISDQER